MNSRLKRFVMMIQVHEAGLTAELSPEDIIDMWAEAAQRAGALYAPADQELEVEPVTSWTPDGTPVHFLRVSGMAVDSHDA